MANVLPVTEMTIEMVLTLAILILIDFTVYGYMQAKNQKMGIKREDIFLRIPPE
jgi:hypothetical protein